MKYEGNYAKGVYEYVEHQLPEAIRKISKKGEFECIE